MGKILKRLDKRLLLFTMIGIFAGVVLFAGTAGTMKATDSGEFCSSCHIMGTAHDTFASSNHATLSCNECHAPTDNITAKLTFKAKAGLGHMYMNTLGANKIPDVLHATSESKEVINQNCINCHEPSLQNVNHSGAYDSCSACHRQVPHNKGDFRPAQWYETKQFFFVEPGRK